MKSLIRALAALLLAASLGTFGLWRNNALPDLTVMTELASSTAQKIASAGESIAASTGVADFSVRRKDTGAAYAEHELENAADPQLESALITGMRNMETAINVASCHKTAAEVGAAMSSVQYSYPEFFYVSNKWSYESSSITGEVQTVRVEYLYSADRVAQMQTTYNAKLDEIAAGVPADGTELDKWLWLHDYFVQNYTYDYTYTIRDAYNFFTQKTGVCQAYMLGLIAAAGRVGLQSLPVTSNEMKHAWNLVRIGDNWYHVDVTWDDNMVLPSYTNYTYFLLSDNGLASVDAETEEGHRKWSTAKAATDTAYDGALYHGARTPVQKTGGVYYTVLDVDSDDPLIQGAIFGGESITELTPKKEIRARWSSGGSSYYIGCFSGLTVHGGKVYYTTHNEMRVYDPATGRDDLTKVRIFYETELRGSYLYGISAVTDTTATLVVASTPTSSTSRTITYTFP